jgi:dUTP pyrophosphatase
MSKFRDLINSILGNEEENNDQTMEIINEYYESDDESEGYDIPNQDINMFKIPLNFVNKSNNPNPEYATEGASGFDLRAFIDGPLTLQPNEFKVIPTGLYFKLNLGFEIQVRSRSGLSAKHGVAVLNSPGTVDSDYTGEVKVILINHGQEPFTINNGDRIAQAVICTTLNKYAINMIQVSDIEHTTDRASNGFGSTGIA